MNQIYFWNCSSLSRDSFEINATSFLCLNLNSSLLINNSIIKQITCLNCYNGGGFIYVLDESYLKIENSIFESNLAIYGSCVFSVQQSQKINFIQNSYFLQNSAQNDGGCIKLINSNFSIFNSTFYGCKSYGYGGAIFSNGLSHSLFINQTSFINNIAVIAGAIYYSEDEITIVKENCIFQNNSAIYFGINFYSNPQRMRLISVQNNVSSYYYYENEYTILNFRSGGDLSNLLVEFMNEENNPITYVSNSSLNIKNPTLIIFTTLNDSEQNSVTINEEKSLVLNFGKSDAFNLSDIKIIGSPNSTANLYLQSSFIKNHSFVNYTFKIKITFRECVIGEIYNGLQCFPCTGKFSFNINDKMCKNCLNGMMCDKNGRTSILHGFWRDDIFSQSIINCDKTAEYCVGGEGYGNYLCSRGHIGPRCQSCDIMGFFWNESFSQTLVFKCESCAEVKVNYIILAVMTVLLFIWMGISVYSSMKNIKTIFIRKFIKALSYYSMIPEKKNEISSYIKIYISYFQRLQVIWDLNWEYMPQDLKFLSLSLANPLQIISNSIDCFLPFIKSSVPHIFLKLIFMFVSPFIYLATFISLGMIIFFKYDASRKFSMAYTAFILVFIFFQPSTIKSTIDVLTCVKINKSSYVKAYLAFSCEDPNYSIYAFSLAIPALVMWGVVLPWYFLICIFLRRKQLDDPITIKKYGYFYQEYRIFFWEFIRIYEKNLIIVIIQYYEYDQVFQSLLILIIFALYYMFLTKFNPYKLRKHNLVEGKTIIVCFTSLFFGVITIVYPVPYVLLISYLTMIIVNLSFNIFFLKKIAESYFQYKNLDWLYDVKFLKFLKLMVPKKSFKTIDLWRRVRRSVAKYLREKSRRNKISEISQADQSLFRLSLNNYDPKSPFSPVKSRRLGNIFDDNFEKKSFADNLEKKSSFIISPKNLNQSFSFSQEEKTFHDEERKSPKFSQNNDHILLMDFIKETNNKIKLQEID